jgi:hypothetical protein
MENQTTMSFTQVNFDSSLLPNVWERYYPLTDGTFAILTHLAFGEGEVSHTVTLHTEIPTEGKDWWDSVISEVAQCFSLSEAEEVVAKLLTA